MLIHAKSIQTDLPGSLSSFSPSCSMWKHQNQVSSTWLIQPPSPGTSLHPAQPYLRRWWMETLSLQRQQDTVRKQAFALSFAWPDICSLASVPRLVPSKRFSLSSHIAAHAQRCLCRSLLLLFQMIWQTGFCAPLWCKRWWSGLCRSYRLDLKLRDITVLSSSNKGSKAAFSLARTSGNWIPKAKGQLQFSFYKMELWVFT